MKFKKSTFWAPPPQIDPGYRPAVRSFIEAYFLLIWDPLLKKMIAANGNHHLKKK